MDILKFSKVLAMCHSEDISSWELGLSILDEVEYEPFSRYAANIFLTSPSITREDINVSFDDDNYIYLFSYTKVIFGLLYREKLIPEVGYMNLPYKYYSTFTIQEKFISEVSNYESHQTAFAQMKSRRIFIENLPILIRNMLCDPTGEIDLFFMNTLQHVIIDDSHYKLTI